MSARQMYVGLVALLVSLVLTGCSSPESASSSSGGGQVAEGGIGGSGSGTASGYGSIWIGGNRHFPVADDAVVTLDGAPVAANSINAVGQGLPLGVTLEYLLADDANADLTEGTAIALEAWHQVIGPVTSVSPLTVLGQPVLVTSDTLLSDNLNNDVANLLVGDQVAIGGMPTSFGSVRATRVEKLDVAPLNWQVLGRIEALDASQFSIREQVISLAGIATENCDAALANGDKVVVQASVPASFTAGDSLDTAWRVICQSEGLGLFADRADLPAQLPAAVDGVITDIDLLAETISLDGQPVDLSGTLEFLLATLSDLSLGLRVEVEGTLDTATGVITAERLTARDPLVSISAPIDQLVGTLVSVLGLDAVIVPGVIDFDSLTAGEQVSLSGFLDSAGQLYVVTGEFLGAADPAAISLSGPISAVDNETGTFSVAGVPFGVATADNLVVETVDGLVEVIELGTCLLDPLLPFLPCPTTDTSEFLDTLVIGSPAQISSATSTGTLLQGGDVLLQ